MTGSESAGGYGRVAFVVNDRWRVVECAHGIQWILQYRSSAETYATSRWTGRSFCRTREALLRCCREHAIDQTAGAFLTALPERIEAASIIDELGVENDVLNRHQIGAAP
jgi:hypothetical protein